MHPAAFMYACRSVTDLPTVSSVLDLGSRDHNGTTRPLFGLSVRYVGVDLHPGNGVDVVADAASVELGETFDMVVSTELLEHTDKAAEVIANARRHLNPGGWFVATMAGPGRAEHGADGASLPPGEFYRNVTAPDLTGWLEAAGFESWEIDIDGEDIRCKARNHD